MSAKEKRLGMLVVTVGIVASFSSAVRAEPLQYLCTVEHTAGLHYDTKAGAWGAKAFGVGRRYVLRVLSDEEAKRLVMLYAPNTKVQQNWGFFIFGSEIPAALCARGAEAILGETFECTPVASSIVTFDRDSRRFEVVFSGGYMDQAYWEQFRREHPTEYKDGFPWESKKSRTTHKHDPDHPDDDFIEIGKCSPS